VGNFSQLISPHHQVLAGHAAGSPAEVSARITDKGARSDAALRWGEVFVLGGGSKGEAALESRGFYVVYVAPVPKSVS